MLSDLYEVRKNMLPEVITKMNADVFGLQEVAFEGYNQISDLLTGKNYKRYSQYVAKTQLPYAKANEIKDPAFQIDGNAICISKKYEFGKVFHKVLHISPVRCAQMMTFEQNGLTINMVNMHLHHMPGEEGIRVHQIYYVLKWVQQTAGEDDLNILVGDFNTLPDTDTYNLVKKFGYTSSYVEKLGREPEKTFHNKMDTPTKDDDPEGTFDYIFYLNNSKKHTVKVENVEIHGTEESVERRLIFASDHLALVTEFKIVENK
jgi:endonuclease/exonuclease/phosphatase family metal-dependent hydrolase